MTSTQISAASKIMLGSTEATKMYIGNTLIWSTEGGGGQVQHDYSHDYFTIESTEDSNKISISKSNTPGSRNMSYSVDNGETWTDLTLTAKTDIATINTGDKIIFKAINDNLATKWNVYWRFSSLKRFKVYGNVMSLLFGDGFENNSEFKSGTSFNLCGLFYGTSTLVDASNLILPATVCKTSSYNGMFRGCTNLVSAPKLPATQSAQDCYSSMFEGCINLEAAPEINLVNMSEGSCMRMFCMDRNNKLTTPKMTKSPILRCATCATNCYKEMFKGNGNLVEVTCLKTDDIECCDNWLANTSSTGTFIKSPLKNNWPNTTSGYPSGWTIVDYVES